MHETRKRRRLGSLRHEKIKASDCVRLSTQHCLDLGPVSGESLKFAGGEEGERQRKLNHFPILKHIRFTTPGLILLSLFILNENNFKAEDCKVQVNVSQDGMSGLFSHRNPEQAQKSVQTLLHSKPSEVQ